MAISPGGRPADASGLGKPGSARGLSDYTREIAHALMRRGVPKSRAIAIARASEAKRFSHSKNPAIAAAAVAAVAQDHVLDHRKRERRDMSTPLTVPAFVDIDRPSSLHSRVLIGGGGGAADLDLDWSAFDSNRPAGQPAQPDLLTPQAHSNVAAFQKAHGLPATGQLDPATVAWLNNPANSAAAQSAATGAAKKTAAAATKTAKAATAAAKKQAAAEKKAANAKVASDKKTSAANTKAQATATKNTAASKSAALAAGKAAQKQSVSLSVPIVGSQDGGRMTDKPAFGGKKAAPFVKGGGKAKNVRMLNMEKLKRAKAARAAK